MVLNFIDPVRYRTALAVQPTTLGRRNIKHCINCSRRSTKATWIGRTFCHRSHDGLMFQHSVTRAKARVDSFVALVYTSDASVIGVGTVWRYLIASYPNTMNYCCSLLRHHFVSPTFAATMPDRSQHRYISSPSQSDPPASQL